jgi:DNA invertase Pin-like site-specific DNA recombinase
MAGFFRSNPQEPVAHYVDEGVSGSVPLAKRAGGGALLKAARPGDKILVAKLDRLFRSVADAAVTLADWAKGEIQLVALAENLDMGSPYGRALAHMASVFAELERELIRDRTKSALRAKKDRGEVCGAVPYGWDAMAGKLVENAAEQAVIAEMKAWRGQGLTTRAIAERLNQLGVPAKRGGRWYGSAVASVLGRSGA